jgi:lipopolysaccharide heptosyltransferase II
MKVLQILPELRVGGVETGTVDFARYLVEHGHEAIVVSKGGDLVTDLTSAGGKHYQLNVKEKNLLTMFWAMRKLEDILIKEKVDIVHARSRVPAWIAYFACRKTRTPFITTCHGYYSKHPFSRVMGWSKLVIVPSQVIGHHMIEDFGVLPENIRCIPRSVDLRKFDIPRDDSQSKARPTIAIVGRITPLKGHEYFLRAMAVVVRAMPYVKIWVIGDAPAEKESYKEGLLALTKHLGLNEHVEFLGSRKDIPQLLVQVDVLVLSTVTQESFGRVILEAQAAGVPVVATRVGGVVELIDEGKTGLLVSPKEPEEMAQAVIKILKDRTLARQMVEQAKAKILSRYTLEHMASQTLKVYQELCEHLNILVIKLSAIGDVLLITPSLKALRTQYPLARIFCLVGKEAREILQSCPYVDDLIIYDSQQKHKRWWKLWKLGKVLRQYNFDKVIDFQNNRKSHLLSFLSFCPERYGYRNKKWGFLLSCGIKDDQGPLPAVEHQFRLLKTLGVLPQAPAELEVWFSKQDNRYINELLESYWLAQATRLVGINVAASARWLTKNWPAEQMAKLCDLLAARNIRVFLTGVEKDKEIAKIILKATKAKPIDLTGKTNILQLAALVKKASVFVTLDSASMHVAAAVKAPFVALFGPTDPFRHLPPSGRCKVIYLKPDCAPCYQGQCSIKTHICMKNITPEQVAAEIENLMPKAES